MDIDHERLHLLEALAEELIKEDPAEEMVVSYLAKAGLADPANPIDRINQVLRAIGFLEENKAIEE